MLLVEEDIPHRGGVVCWTPLSAWPHVDQNNDGEVVEASRSEIHRKTETAEEVKKEMHRSTNARMWWSKAKIAETQLTIDHDFQRKLKQRSRKQIEDKEPEWQIVRRRRTRTGGGQNTDEDFLKDSDSSVSLICKDFLRESVGRRERQRTDLKKIDGRKKQGLEEENKTNTECSDGSRDTALTRKWHG